MFEHRHYRLCFVLLLVLGAFAARTQATYTPSPGYVFDSGGVYPTSVYSIVQTGFIFTLNQPYASQVKGDFHVYFPGITPRSTEIVTYVYLGLEVSIGGNWTEISSTYWSGYYGGNSSPSPAKSFDLSFVDLSPYTFYRVHGYVQIEDHHGGGGGGHWVIESSSSYINSGACNSPPVVTNVTDTSSCSPGTRILSSSEATDAEGNMGSHNFEWAYNGTWSQNLSNSSSYGTAPGAGSSFSPTGYSARQVYFTPLQPGTYTVRWSASDSQGYVYSSTSSITVTQPQMVDPTSQNYTIPVGKPWSPSISVPPSNGSGALYFCVASKTNYQTTPWTPTAGDVGSSQFWVAQAQDSTVGGANLTLSGIGAVRVNLSTYTVTVVPSMDASISVSPSIINTQQTAVVNWSSSNATSVSVAGSAGSGFTASGATSGSQSVSGLAVGTYTYTILANDGFGGSVTKSCTLTVTTPPVTASISVDQSSGNAPAGTTVRWSSNNASSVSVTGSAGSGFSTSAAPSGSQAVSGLPVGTYTFTITAQGTNGPVLQTASFVVSPASNVVASISTDSSSATAPGGTTVRWSSNNASSVSVTGSAGSGFSTSAAPSGSQAVSGLPAGTYTFTITAQGNGGPATQTATFTVNPPIPPVTASISVTQTNGTAPGATTINWSSTNATSVSVTGSAGSGFSSSAATSGSQAVSGLPVGTYTFTITAQGNGGPATQTATFTVSPVSPTVNADISLSQTSANSPGSSTVSWSSSNASSVSVTGSTGSGFITSTSTSGTQGVSSLPAGTYTFTITAQGNGGPITRTAVFTVNPSVDASISVNPITASPPGGTTITWSSSNATSVSVTGSAGSGFTTSVLTGGSQGVSGLSAGTYTFTITAQGNGGPITRTATFTVQPLVTATISLSQASANAPGSTTVIWSSSNATGVSVTGSAGSGFTTNYSTSGSQAVTGLPSGTYTFTITAQGNGGPITQTVTFAVSATGGPEISINWL